MRIAFIGAGYVGLVSGTCFAEYGNQVYCVDIDKDKIEKLNDGIIPIYEPGLEEMVRRNAARGRLYFCSELKEALAQSDLIFLTIGTPDDGQGGADLNGIFTAAKEIGGHLDAYKVIITKSTVPVGTAHKLGECIAQHSTQNFDIVSNPEFLREGHAIQDFMHPERVVIGVDSPQAKELLGQLYHPFQKEGVPLLFMSNRSAELVKYACNSFLAMKISFANEMANLCDILEADYHSVRQGLATDKRIGEQFLAAGIGYGGSCFPKDVRALAQTAKEHGHPIGLLDEVEAINERQKLRVVEILQAHFKTDDFSGYHFAVWGLAFKPDTDDMRDAPSINIIRKLLEMGAKMRVNDPAAYTTTYDILGDKVQYTDMYGALSDADALLLLTEWPDFQEPDFAYIQELLKQPVIIDGRNVYNSNYIRELGFIYYGIGVNTSV